MPREIPDVIGTELVEAAWGNDIRDRAVMRYVDQTALDAAVPVPEVGETVVLTATELLQFFDGAVWVPLATVVEVDAVVAALGVVGAWQFPTLQNGWVNFGSGEQEVRYRLERDGTTVRMQFVIRSGSTTVNSEIFTLAVGFRPLRNLNQPAASANGYGQVKILTTGVVAFRAGSNGDFSINTTFTIDPN